MQRQHPLLSPTGLIMTLVVLFILSIVYIRTGGQMFSPGDAAAAHSEIEDCAACHQPFGRSQGELCMDCHTEIREELLQQNGLHARLSEPERCMACHSEHQGEDFDIRASAIDRFDHEMTFFSLVRHAQDYDGSAMSCSSCHTADNFNADLTACKTCHENDSPAFMEQHIADFGPDCLACHDGVDRLSGFDHSLTAFPLIGEHAETACADCHQNGQFDDLPLQCAACHAEPEAHLGMFQNSCEDCHNPAGWTPANFDGRLFEHFENTGFSLVKHEQNVDGSILDCKACHQESLTTFDALVCVDCHRQIDDAFITQHLVEYGQDCMGCHDGLDSMSGFDHSTVFVLDGAHAALACTGCHIDQQFSDTPSNCSDCHAEPELHLGIFGLQCENCHTTSAWQPAALSRHDFPLDHGNEGEIPCATCHPANFVQFTCDTCHTPAEMREEHNKEDIFDIAGRCLECHPTGLKEEGED